ncbi:MAG: CDP-diacylglycerol--serine O-phosphatidyltransferase [Steroidobacteraceae bacterium]
MNSEPTTAPRPDSPTRRGIYLLPNLFTTGCLACGFFAIVAAINGDFARASIAIYVAMIFDGLDGRVARWTRTESTFGKEYDSLADMVAFGVAPALVAYQWGFAAIAEYGEAWARFGWISAFFYTACAALRLARFNSRAPSADKRYFEGLPSPSAAGLVAAYVWFASEWAAWSEPGLIELSLTFSVCAIAGALMVSSIPYPSIKQIDWNARVKFFYFVIVPISLAFVAAWPPPMLLILFSLYVALAPALWVLRRVRRGSLGRP